jgi:glucokinase
MKNQWIVGVDLGGTTTKIAFITLDGEIKTKWEIPTDNSEEGINITANIAKAIEDKLVELGKDRSELLGIGMGAPGPVDYELGIIRNAVNLGWKDNFPLQAQLEAATSLPAMIENDANCAALGEMWMGAGKGTKDLVFVTLGTGVGGGVIANGNIVRGVNGAGGEIGHITVVPNGGSRCNCGRYGCLETVTSATGIVRLAKELLSTANVQGELADKFVQNGNITAKEVFDAARNGDESAGQIVDKVAFYLGLALGGIANTLNPEKIVLGGGVSKAGDFLLDVVKKKFDEFAFSSVKESTGITLATLGNDAGVFGAAWLIKNRSNM